MLTAYAKSGLVHTTLGFPQETGTVAVPQLIHQHAVAFKRWIHRCSNWFSSASLLLKEFHDVSWMSNPGSERFLVLDHAVTS